MLKGIVKTLLICLLLAGHCMADEAFIKPADLPAWATAKRVMQKCYSAGLNFDVSVSGGYEHRIYSDGPVDGEFANAVVSVPIYSKKERLSRQDDVNKKTEHLADLYSDYEEHSAVYNSLSDERKLLKQTMIDTGAKGIQAYYGLIRDIEAARAKCNSAARKILMILENCGYVETN